MIKKIFGITTLLFLSVFLIMPVYASEPDPFVKTTDIFPGDLDYKNSLIDWNGYNLDLKIIKDMSGGLDPTDFSLYVFENGKLIYLLNTWVKLYLDDSQDYQYYLNITSSQETKIKKILFNRFVDNNVSYDIDYIMFVMRNQTGVFDPFAVYFRIEMKSLLKIDFKSVYISDSIRQNLSGMLNNFNKGVMFRDQQNNLIENITLDDNNTQLIGTGADAPQRALYNFTQKYTNIKYIDLVFLISANSYDPRPTLLYKIDEIGFFADNQVILPDLDIDTDFQIYQPTICGIFDLACVSRNLIGELSNTVYNRLGADSIASSILDIYDTLFYPVYIIDNSAWQNAILAIYVMFPIGIIIMIIKRVT